MPFRDRNEPTTQDYAALLQVVSRHGTDDCDREEQAAAVAVLAEVLLEESAERHDADRQIDRWSAPGF